eukprot:3391710-Prymnesium_polylepis.1
MSRPLRTVLGLGVGGFAGYKYLTYKPDTAKDFSGAPLKKKIQRFNSLVDRGQDPNKMKTRAEQLQALKSGEMYDVLVVGAGERASGTGMPAPRAVFLLRFWLFPHHAPAAVPRALQAAPARARRSTPSRVASRRRASSAATSPTRRRAAVRPQPRSRRPALPPHSHRCGWRDRLLGGARPRTTTLPAPRPRPRRTPHVRVHVHATNARARRARSCRRHARPRCCAVARSA